MSFSLSIAIFSTFGLGCGQDYAVNGEETDQITEDHSEWDGASLAILSPQTGDFIALGEPFEFEAVVSNADGEETDWTELAWSSDADDAWDQTGTSFSDDTLAIGEHTFTVSTELPNGDRLVTSAGWFLVQHEDAGTYVGEVSIDLAGDYDGTEVSATCIGATTIIVDQTGETATGDTVCSLSLFGYDMDSTYDFELQVDDGELSGEAVADLTFIEYAFEVDGNLVDGEMDASWNDDVYGFMSIDGALNATRVTRSIEF